MLVIDEAYALNDNMYGKQALDTIVEKVMGKPGDDIAVLMLGYEKQVRTCALSRVHPGTHAFSGSTVVACRPCVGLYGRHMGSDHCTLDLLSMLSDDHADA